MTKHVATCKNMADSHEQEDAEEATALSSDVRTVRKLTGETPGAQGVWDVTGTVMEERRVEETPLSTQEQVLQCLQCLSTERCKLTGASSNHTEKVWQQEAAEEPSQDHESDQEDTKDEESLSEANQRADWLEFIRGFQEIMNKAIEQLLNKPVRRHSHWKDKPEPHMEQGKCKETICKEAVKLPQYKVNRDSDDEWNSIVFQETMDTDWCTCTWGYVWMNFRTTRHKSYGPCPSWRWGELQLLLCEYLHMHQRLVKFASRIGRSLKRHSDISSFPYMNALTPWIDWSHTNTIRESVWWMSTLMNLKSSLKRQNTWMGLLLSWNFGEVLTLLSRLTLNWCLRDIWRKTNLWTGIQQQEWWPWHVQPMKHSKLLGPLWQLLPQTLQVFAGVPKGLTGFYHHLLFIWISCQ